MNNDYKGKMECGRYVTFYASGEKNEEIVLKQGSLQSLERGYYVTNKLSTNPTAVGPYSSRNTAWRGVGIDTSSIDFHIRVKRCED